MSPNRTFDGGSGLKRTIAGVGVALVFANGLGVQDKPNFSGRWTLVSPADMVSEMGISGRVVLVIAQDSRTLSLEDQANPGKSVYKLDGTDSRNGADVARASWSGAKIVIVHSDLNGGHGPTERRIKTVMSLDENGMLVVEHIDPGPPTNAQIYGYKRERLDLATRPNPQMEPTRR